jgi:hypothetical protein
MTKVVTISAAVEGTVDEAVARRLILFAGGCLGPVHVKQGKQSLQQRVGGYNDAAKYAPWMVLVDLDNDHVCAAQLRAAWLAQQAPCLCFRIAVRAVEAWLLADFEAIATFLRVARGKIPREPEILDNPKATIVALAQGSRRPEVREDMVPRNGSGRSVGPAYSSRLIEFASLSWRPAAAAARAESLRRAIDCLRRLCETAAGTS